MEEKRGVPLKKKKRRKNRSALEGHLHLYVGPEQRALLDKISKKERFSLCFLGSCAISLLLNAYQESGNILEVISGYEPKRAGRRRQVYELED